MFKSVTRFAIFIVSILVVSCQKEISVELANGGSITTGALRMKIDGVQWIASRSASARLLGGFTTINGMSADAKSLSISLNDTVPGTYVLDQMSFSTAALSDSLDLTGLAYSTGKGKDTTQAGGTVVVTTIDKVNKTISGTFHFKMFRDFDSKQKVITEGIFDKLPYSQTLPPAAITDTFYVKIDNVDWTAKSISGTTSGTNFYLTGSELDVSKLVAIAVPATITPGTYSLDVLVGTYIGIYSPIANSLMTSQSGNLTIIERNTVSKRIRGKFDFKAVDFFTFKSSQLSGGYFSIAYQ